MPASRSDDGGAFRPQVDVLASDIEAFKRERSAFYASLTYEQRSCIAAAREGFSEQRVQAMVNALTPDQLRTVMSFHERTQDLAQRHAALTERAYEVALATLPVEGGQ
jgi:hypothetical protein